MENAETITSSAAPLLRLDQVTKLYQEGGHRIRAVDQLSLELVEGEVLGLVGESGCGKSTTGNLILHLERPTQGSIQYRGQEISRLSERSFRPLRREIQMIFQDPYSSMNPRRTIGWLMEEALTLQRRELKREARREMILAMLREVGLEESYLGRYPAELSGGQRQRVSIALALLGRPSLLVADEPVSALDISVQAQILNLLGRLQKKYSLTCLLISHDLNVVSYLADRIAVMYLGNLVELGTCDQVGAAPAHPYTQALFSASAGGGGKPELVLQGEIPSPETPPSGCPFHTRCPYAEERCRQEKPILENKACGSWVACHRVHENKT